MGQTLTKSELIDELVSFYDGERARVCEAGAAVIIRTMAQTLVDGNRIEIRGFGSFGLKFRPQRTGRNPQDGSPVAVHPRYSVFFKAGKGLRERVDKAS